MDAFETTRPVVSAVAAIAVAAKTMRNFMKRCPYKERRATCDGAPIRATAQGEGRNHVAASIAEVAIPPDVVGRQ